MKKLVLLFSLLFIFNITFSQEWEVIPYEDITDESIRIASLFQDDEGNVWGGNAFAGRVIRWDGESWEVFNNDVTLMDFESPAINSIFQDSNGRILFCSDDGVGVYENNTWSNINTTNSGLPVNFTRDVIEENGVFWFLAGMNLVSFDGTIWTTYEVPDVDWFPSELAAMEDGRIFITTPNGDPVRRFDDGQWEIFSTDNSNINSNFQYYIGKVDGNTFWFGGPAGNGNLYENGEFTPSEEIDNWGMGTDYFTDIHVNGSKDNVWFGSGFGLHHLNGDSWETFDSDNSPMTNEEIQSVIIDPDGKIWFSTRNEIIIYTPQTTSTISGTLPNATINISPNPVSDLLQITFSNQNNVSPLNNRINITSIGGQSVLTETTIGQASITVDVSTLPSGIYTVEYIDGKQIITERFVKK